MDWTKLRVLELNMLSVNTLNSINWSMPNLLSFRSDLPLAYYVESLDGWCAYNEALSAFVSRLPTRLQSLGFRSFYLPFSLERIADIHGQSLKSLERRGGNGQYRWYLNDTELRQIREQFPVLEHLEIDLDRNQTWHVRHLASFPRLNHLTLWLKLGYNDYQLPLLTNSSATSLFHALRSHKNGTDLTHTTVYLGPCDAYPSRDLTGPSWSTGRLAKVECSAKRGASPEDGGCRFHGYDPSQPETANWHIRYWDESRSLFSLFDEPKD